MFFSANSEQSASYSSTAGALPGSMAGNSYSASSAAKAAVDTHRNASPRSVASSAATRAYTPNLAPSSLSTSMSPNIKPSAGLEGSAGHGDMRVQMDPTGQSMSQWSVHHQVPQYSTGLANTGRVSWDYGAVGAYLDHSTPGSAMASSAQPLQPLQLHRTDVTADLSQMPDDDGTYQPYGQRTTRV